VRSKDGDYSRVANLLCVLVVAVCAVIFVPVVLDFIKLVA
jgi:hypothetical protein